MKLWWRLIIYYMAKPLKNPMEAHNDSKLIIEHIIKKMVTSLKFRPCED